MRQGRRAELVDTIITGTGGTGEERGIHVGEVGRGSDAEAQHALTLELHCQEDAVQPFEEGRCLADHTPEQRLGGLSHPILESDPGWPRFQQRSGRFPRFMNDGQRQSSAGSIQREFTLSTPR